MTTYQELVEKVSNMTEKEILRYEMETLLLASQEATETEIPSIALAMTAIHDRLASQKWITPDIKVSMPEGNSPDIHIIADSIKKLLIELMRTVPENVSLSSEELKRYRDTADKRMETGGYKERTKWRRFELLTETEP